MRRDEVKDAGGEPAEDEDPAKQMPDLHRAAVALTVAHYNLCTMHRSIRMTPAMKAGLVNRPWPVAELLAT